ncbi:MAG: RidA family protein [Gemmatimonadota bacterium]|jgi:2-iminobutanoate/2-iminopropanoate deaminase
MHHVEALHTEGAPAAIGPYSQACLAGGFLYSAGQIGLDPATGELVGPGLREQAYRVFENLHAVLAEAGADFGDVVKTTVYVADMADFAELNGIYAEHFEEPFPARSTIEAGGLPAGARVEIDVVARLR